MRKLHYLIIGAALSALVIVPSVAFAGDPQGNGQGQTPLSASMGFNAKADLGGKLNYNSDPQGPFAGFDAHCDGYTSFKLGHSGDGYPKITVTATCQDKDGVTVYLRAQFTDRGEPGTLDSVCIVWSYTTPKPKHQNAFIHDHGIILNGNIQIHEDAQTGLMTAEMLSTP